MGVKSGYNEITISLNLRLVLSPGIDVLQYITLLGRGKKKTSQCLGDNTKIEIVTRSSWLV